MAATGNTVGYLLLTFKLGPSTFGMEILSNTKNSRPDIITLKTSTQ